MSKLLRCFQGVVNTQQFALIYSRMSLEIVAATAAVQHGRHVDGLYGHRLYLMFKQWVRHPNRLFAVRAVPRDNWSRIHYKANVFPKKERGMVRYHIGRYSSNDSRHRWVATLGYERTMDMMLDIVRKITLLS